MFNFLWEKKKPLFHNGVEIGYWVGKPFLTRRHTDTKRSTFEQIKGFAFILKGRGKMKPLRMLDPGFREGCLTYAEMHGHMLATQINKVTPEGHVSQMVFLDETDKTVFENRSCEEYSAYLGKILGDQSHARTYND